MSTSGERRIVLGTCHHDCPDSCGWEVTVEDGLWSVAVGAAAHRSIDEGRAVTLDEVLAPG